MLKIVSADSCEAQALLLELAEPDEAVERAARSILRDVRARGDAAVIEYTERFDRARIDSLRVPENELAKAWDTLDDDMKRILSHSAQNIEAYHRRQLRSGYTIAENPGVVMGQRVLPLERVGIYAPGGTASYPSSVLMNAIPARLAGVRGIALATPPGADGGVPMPVLAAAYLAGVTEVYRMGGVQAIGALAYGTASVPRVDKIVGPGNAYVIAAKRQVFGAVAIDMIAGPSEIAIIADAPSDPECVAADLLSQAEHDARARALLITDSAPLAERVQAAVARRLARLPRGEIAARSIENKSAILVADNLEACAELVNQIAPEHLELCVDDPFALLPSIRSAASIFMGRNAPEALGDYMAGPNHTLPTGGTARFFSPLSVDDFIKKSSYIYYTRDALAAVKDDVAAFAVREGLDAHARSVLVRFGEA